MAGFGKALKRLNQATPSPGPRFSEQLKFLRDPESYASRPDFSPMGSLPDGRVESTANGSHYVITESFPDDHFHGKVRLNRMSLEDLSPLLKLADCSHPDLDRERIVFLDTETTGVQGGAGMCPFLIGVGFFEGDVFRVVQYFIRDFDEEPSMLLALGELLARFDLIVTYNGRTFDLPLVENRCVLSRLERPFGHLAHFDLLFMARRLWRAGHGSCRLTALEEKLIGFQRGPDIHGSMIPQVYFDYVHSSDARRLRSVFSHNVYDILSLAGLAIHAADQVVSEPATLDDALDLYSLGRIFDRAGNRPKGVHCYELALASRLPSAVRRRILERLSVLERVSGEHIRSLERCQELIAGSEFSIVGYEGAAIFHEHRSRDLETAARLLDEALERIDGVVEMDARRLRLQVRRERLQAKLSRRQALADLSVGDLGPGCAPNAVRSTTVTGH